MNRARAGARPTSARRQPNGQGSVGYGRPPTKSQFKKGKSGNPKGRPKGVRSVGSVLQDVIRQRIAITENGRTRSLPALEVMLRRLANDAMRNDPRALKLVLSLVERYSESPDVDTHLEEILAEDQAILARFLPETTNQVRTRKKKEPQG